MFTLDVKAYVGPAIDYLNRLKAGLGDQVIVSSLNKTVAQASTQMARGISQTYNIKVSDVKSMLSIQRAKRAGKLFTATLVGNPFGTSKRSLNVIRFLEKVVTLAQARKRKKAGTLNQLQFQILRTGGKTLIHGAFIGNKGRTVFMREGPGRLPIKAVQTIGVPQMFQAKKVQLPVQQLITDNFPRIFDSEFRYYVSTLR